MAASGSPASDVDRQLPLGGEIFLDHIAHFVPAVEDASAALKRAGFQPTPVSIQCSHDANGENRPTGTGNVTAMFVRGYAEVLFKTADEPLGIELDQAIARYPGVHLVAFATSDARAKQARLASSGFRVRPIAALRRPVATRDGEAEAAFTVARIEPGEMREGRLQYLTHHSEAAVWQTRWLTHENGVQGLIDVIVAVDDVAEASARYARFLGRQPVNTGMGEGFFLERGGVQLMERNDFERLLGLKCPSMPFIGCYALRARSLVAVEGVLARGAIAAVRRGHVLVAPFPAALGVGAWIFVEEDRDLPWRQAPS